MSTLDQLNSWAVYDMNPHIFSSGSILLAIPRGNFDNSV